MALRKRRETIDNNSLDNKTFKIRSNTNSATYILKYHEKDNRIGYKIGKTSWRTWTFWDLKDVLRNISDGTWVIQDT